LRPFLQHPSDDRARDTVRVATGFERGPEWLVDCPWRDVLAVLDERDPELGDVEPGERASVGDKQDAQRRAGLDRLLDLSNAG